ncbi:MAG TPA: site-2 protease family protein [Anaerolineae bacterium]|nr:site-2 protease family protein [Anaerolineae bacterium]
MLIPFSVESLIAFAVVVLAAFPLHEYGHAWMAVRLGDRTPYYQGRLTLDPRAHLDLVGTLLLAVAGFGWAKPVQFVPYNLRNAPSFKVGIVLVALAGPLMNILIAMVAALLLRIDIGNRTVDGILGAIVLINLLLAVFNMIPLVPLDGSKVLWGLMPDSWSRAYEQIQQYSLFILLILIVPIGGVSLLSRIIFPIVSTLQQAFVGL